MVLAWGGEYYTVCLLNICDPGAQKQSQVAQVYL